MTKELQRNPVRRQMLGSYLTPTYACFPDEEQRIVKALLIGMILKHETQRWGNV